MQEQTIPDPQAKPAIEFQEDLLLSFLELDSHHQPQPAIRPQSASLKKAPITDHLGLMKTSSPNLDDSMLLTNLFEQDSKDIQKEIQNIESGMTNSEVITSLKKIQENPEKEASLTAIEKKMNLKNGFHCFEEKESRGDQSQFQTINQSDILKSSKILSLIQRQKTKEEHQIMECQKSHKASNEIVSSHEIMSSRKLSSGNKKIENPHQKAIFFSSQKKNQERICDSQEKLLNLLHSSYQFILEKKEDKKIVLQKEKQLQEVLSQHQCSLSLPQEESMVVNYSEGKNKFEMLTPSETNQSENRKRDLRAYLQNNELMEIEQNEKKCEFEQFHQRNNTQMEIEVPKRSIPKSQINQDKSSIFSCGESNKYSQTLIFPTEIVEEKLEFNKSLPELQNLNQSVPSLLLDESRHLSIEVNVNEDSLPCNLEPSFQNYQNSELPAGNENIERRESLENDRIPIVLQQEIDSFQISEPLIQSRKNGQNNRKVCFEVIKQSEDDLLEPLEIPHHQLSQQKQAQVQYHFKTENYDKTIEGIVDLKEQSPTELITRGKDVIVPEMKQPNATETYKENNTFQIQDDQSSKSQFNSFTEPINEENHSEGEQQPNLLIPEKNYARQEVEEPNSLNNIGHQRMPQEQNINVLQVQPSLSQDNRKDVAIVHSLPPSITININRHHQISLNIFNNNPLPAQNYSQEPIKVNKAVQHEYTSTDQNQTFLEENHKKDMTFRNEFNLKEKKVNLNSSIDLEREQNRPRIQVEVQTQPIQEQIQMKQLETDTQINIQQEYFKICDFADFYLLQKSCSEQQHSEFQKLIKGHLTRRLSTEPSTPLGIMLFKNGLFLTAIVKFFTKNSQTPFLSNYLFEYFSSAFTIQHNQFIFQDTARKAKENYISYMDQKYQKIILDQRQQSDLRSTSENLYVRRQSIKMPTEEVLQKSKECRPRNLALSSSSFSLNQKFVCPVNQQLKQHQPQIVRTQNGIAEPLKEKKIEEVNPEVVQTNSLNSREFKLGRLSMKQKEVSINQEKKNSEEKGLNRETGKESKKKEKIKIEEVAYTDFSNSSIVNNPQEQNQTELQQLNLIAPSLPQNANQKFAKMFEKYKQVRESVLTTIGRKAEPQGILKISSESKEKDNDSEVKKKKSVQFIEDQVQEEKEISKDGSNQEEDHIPLRPRRKRKSRSKGDRSNEGADYGTRNRTASKR